MTLTLRNHTFKRTFVVIFGLVLALTWWALVQPGAQAEPVSGPQSVRGAGVTIVEGGTGEPDFAPVITKFAIHWDGEAGALECLALTPTEPAGEPGSGTFDKNVMYVTGGITSAEKDPKSKAVVLTGTATVTGVGAGKDRPFTATVTEGGPGATFVLEVSGLTFREIVLEGEIEF